MKIKDAEELDINKIFFQIFEKIFDYITGSDVTNTIWGKILTLAILIISILIILAVIFNILTKALEAFVKVIESVKSSGFLSYFSQNKKKEIRKRKQFFSVLDADLAYLAKAESWNDQYFTDLEAEVEADGGYYLTAFDRLRRKKFSGVRRVRSLIQAIDSSSERSILLVGEPGSGKSVALRHLAKQLAERGKKSTKLMMPMPLYLNLRELEIPSGETVSADHINRFVLENIRRGDADTSSFVSDNWQEYKTGGLWFFLFDSFDEIPEVMHAATGSVAVRQYSSAIRHFLDGMGECRSILASREYKGPESLPWKKFRILPLAEKLQNRLLDNSFLDKSHIDIVRQHLAVERSTLGNNPLFLTLICRYVKDHNVYPANDHQLLTSHIERLASRDAEYTLKRFSLTPKQLIAGAELLAVKFAENPTLSLSPKVDDIYEAFGTELPSDYLQRLVEALVDVKIGRTDVSTARAGDRRFAFSHRRYQETLFANYIAANSDYLSPDQLLLNPEWREYAVTLLQTQKFIIIEPLLLHAVDLIKIEQKRKLKISAEGALTRRLGYYDWKSTSVASILEILQEGMSRRLNDIPQALSVAVYRLLYPIWRNGDHFDKYMVIRVGGILPQPILSKLIEISLRDPVAEVRAIAFKQCLFIRETSKELNILILKRLAKEVLSTSNSVEILRLKALASELPASIGAEYVIQRCKRLRPILARLNLLSLLFTFPGFVVTKFFDLIGLKSPTFNTVKSMLTFRYRGGPEWLVATIMCPVFFTLIALKKPIKSIVDSKNSDLEKIYQVFGIAGEFIPVILVYILLVACIINVYISRAEGNKIGVLSFFSKKKIKFLAKHFVQTGLPAAAGIIFVFFSFWCTGWTLRKIFDFLGLSYLKNEANVSVGVLTLTAISLIFIGSISISKRRKQNSMKERFKIKKETGFSDFEIFFAASTPDEASFWLMTNRDFLKNSVHTIRSISVLLLAHPQVKESELGERSLLMSQQLSGLDTYELRTLVGHRTLAATLDLH